MLAYVSTGDVMGAAGKTIVALMATAARRPKLKQITIGCSDSPADATAVFAIRRITAAGTGTAKTAFQADGADGAPVVTPFANYTVEPTYVSGEIVRLPMNQRATMVWETPDDEGGEISSLLGVANGVGIQMISGPAVNWSATVCWEE